MSDPAIAQPDQPGPILKVDSPTSTSRYRRSVAFLSLLMNVGIVAATLLRGADLGPNATEIIVWVVLANGVAILGSVGFKSWETIGVFRGRQP